MSIKKTRYEMRDGEFIEAKPYGAGLVLLHTSHRCQTVPESEWRRLCRESCEEPNELKVKGGTVSIWGDMIRICSDDNAKGAKSTLLQNWHDAYDLWTESPVDDEALSGWRCGPPTEIGKTVVVANSARTMQFGRARECTEEPESCIIIGDMHVLKSDIYSHLIIPDPPAPKPIPEPPKWVRVKHVSGNRIGFAFDASGSDAEHPWLVRWDDGCVDRYEADSVEVIDTEAHQCTSHTTS